MRRIVMKFQNAEWPSLGRVVIIHHVIYVYKKIMYTLISDKIQEKTRAHSYCSHFFNCFYFYTSTYDVFRKQVRFQCSLSCPCGLGLYRDYPNTCWWVQTTHILLCQHNVETLLEELTNSLSREYHWCVTIICRSRYEYLSHAPIASYEHLWKNPEKFGPYLLHTYISGSNEVINQVPCAPSGNFSRKIDESLYIDLFWPNLGPKTTRKFGP